MMPATFRRSAKITMLFAGTLLGGCATLPSSGPTARQITRAEQADANRIGFRIIDIDQTVAGELAREPSLGAPPRRIGSLSLPGTNDHIGPGDILQITIYEVGVSLFSSGGSRDTSEGFDPSARGGTFSNVVVGQNGTIKLPYMPPLGVEGLTTLQAQTLIEQALRGKSQAPQALVSIRQNVANATFISGDVRKPGRLELGMAGERLLDAIALAGGTTNATEDMLVRFSRGGVLIEQPLGTIKPTSVDDIPLRGGDRIELVRRGRSFTVFGATTKVSQVAFDTASLSLAEAIARVGGPNDGQADASAIFLFRYELDGKDKIDHPVLYRLNMMAPSSYFLSQRIAMRDKDVIYIANAQANQPSKLINIINQLFSPFITARAITR